jgi:hypothetical protein
MSCSFLKAKRTERGKFQNKLTLSSILQSMELHSLPGNCRTVNKSIFVCLNDINGSSMKRQD